MADDLGGMVGVVAPGALFEKYGGKEKGTILRERLAMRVHRERRDILGMFREFWSPEIEAAARAGVHTHCITTAYPVGDEGVKKDIEDLFGITRDFKVSGFGCHRVAHRVNVLTFTVKWDETLH